MVNSLSFFGQNTGGSAAQNTEHILILYLLKLKLRLKLAFSLRSSFPVFSNPSLITHHFFLLGVGRSVWALEESGNWLSLSF